jgi:hypothetical protein
MAVGEDEVRGVVKATRGVEVEARVVGEACGMEGEARDIVVVCGVGVEVRVIRGPRAVRPA